MERRVFIKNTSSVILGTATAPKFFSSENEFDLYPDTILNGKLKGFIVSDAHFGWDHKDQPSPEMQKTMMERIFKRFSDLDIFIDTGDAHHSSLQGETGDNARGNWTDIIAGGCYTTPFYYVAGNHDIIGNLNDGDQEWRCNAMGSASCRPYYSVDIKGIHFISLPELMHAIYINKESIDWLKLDLEINKDKTVILFSHNNIKGTTTLTGEIGYRGLVNSRELLELFKLYPNVISWMNGHNHTFEVVKKAGMLYVSNGRMGGFVPPQKWGRVGQGHLGGIYFEVTSDSLTVRGYSASGDKFFDEMGDSHLSGHLKTKTTFASFAKPSYSFGAGGMGNGEMIPVFNHHLSPGSKAELFFRRSDTAAINEDPDFSLFEFKDPGLFKVGDASKTDNLLLLMGASVGSPKYSDEKKNNLWKFRNPGLQLLHQDNPDTFIDISIPDRRLSKYCYYRGVPGKKYKVILDLYTFSGGQKLEMELHCYDSLGNELKRINGPYRILEPGRKSVTTVFDIPEFPEADTIYTNKAKDRMIQVSVQVRFTQMKGDIFLSKFVFSEDADNRKMINPEVLINGKSFSFSPELKSGDIKQFFVTAPSENRIVFQTKYNGGPGLTWLYRQNAIEWQVRNATVSDKGNYFEIGALRNTWTISKEIIIVPFYLNHGPFIHRLRNIHNAKIYPFNRNNKLLKIEIAECAGIGIVQVFSLRKPKEIQGCIEWNFENRIVSIEVKNNSQISVIF